jgi:hypothetical protein
VSITKVVVFSTKSPTKLVWHFSEFSMIFYAFYKFQKNGYTIEDVTLRLGPWKDPVPRNWVPRPTGRWARWKSDGSGDTPGRGTARGRVHAHLGSIGSRDWRGEVAGAGARRWPAAAAAAARGSGEEGARLGDARPRGGAMGSREESGTVGRR